MLFRFRRLLRALPSYLLLTGNSRMVTFIRAENTPPEMPDKDPAPPPAIPPTPPSKVPFTTPMDPSKKENDWAMITHLSGLCSAIGIPSFIGPLICWLIKKDEYPKVDFAGKEALNFQLSILIVQLVSIPLTFIVGLGFVTFSIAAIGGLVYTIIAAVSASKGEDYAYPFNFRMIK